jgi:hypothetical protein
MEYDITGLGIMECGRKFLGAIKTGPPLIFEVLPSVDSRPTPSRSRGAKCATDLNAAGMTNLFIFLYQSLSCSSGDNILP